MNESLISVLMPVYNAEPFLRECLDSILAQSEQDWELWAINDFSTDNSREILQQYTQKDSRINVLQNNRKGIIGALRLAYQKANGTLITRMDADDLMPNTKLATLKGLLQKHGKGHVATGKVHYFPEAIIGDGYRRYQDWLNRINLEGTTYREIYKECVIASPCWMVWRSDLDQCGAFESNQYPEDYDLVFRFYKNQLKVLCANETMHLWRDHGDRASRNDEHYANNSYFKLKVPYFLKLDHEPNRPLVIWGAGKKGKHLARLLSEANQDFHWVCDNPNKIGRTIYNIPVSGLDHLDRIPNAQIIVAVSNPEEQGKMEQLFIKEGQKKGKDYFFFC